VQESAYLCIMKKVVPKWIITWGVRHTLP
jgi:hypothetical protein